jgi:AraC-like DNA-binding protein
MGKSGCWELRVALPSEFLVGDVAGYAGFEERPGRMVRRREIPSPSPTIIVSLDERLRVSAIGNHPTVTLVRSFLVSPDAAPVIVEHSGSLRCLEIELSPWAASSCFGPLGRLPGGILPLEVIWQREAGWLQEQLAELPDWELRFALVDRLLATKITALKRVVRPEIRWAWNEIKRLNGKIRIAQIVGSIGWSSRHFISCFREQTGLTPKAAARRFRFDRARRLVSGAGLTLTEVALACGYSDQSHLTREFDELAGCSPSAYRHARFADLPGIPADLTNDYP